MGCMRGVCCIQVGPRAGSASRRTCVRADPRRETSERGRRGRGQRCGGKGLGERKGLKGPRGNVARGAGDEVSYLELIHENALFRKQWLVG